MGAQACRIKSESIDEQMVVDGVMSGREPSRVAGTFDLRAGYSRSVAYVKLWELCSVAVSLEADV